MNHVDALIVGSGLSGLAAAIELHRSGFDVRILEASDHVGGRMRTDRVDGYLLDRGFQVINPYYPELRRLGVLDQLDLRPLSAGVLVSLRDRLWPLGDPRREPRWMISSALTPAGSPIDKARLVLYALHCSQSSVYDLIEQDDIDMSSAIASAGVGRQLYDAVIRPFLTGVFLTDPRDVSRRYGELVLRSFVRGTPSLPARGVGELPAALARLLPAEITQFHSTVSAIEGTRVVTDQGAWTCDALIVAVDPVSVPDLLDGFPEKEMKSCVTWYHVTDEPPTLDPVLAVDGRGRGPVVNSVVLSNVSPHYAPNGKSLIATTTLSSHVSMDEEQVIRAQLRLMWGVDTRSWELLRGVAVPHALPLQLPGQAIRQEQRVGERVWVAGDHLDTPSQQGALVSGRRAARAVLETLRAQ